MGKHAASVTSVVPINKGQQPRHESMGFWQTIVTSYVRRARVKGIKALRQEVQAKREARLKRGYYGMVQVAHAALQEGVAALNMARAGLAANVQSLLHFGRNQLTQEDILAELRSASASLAATKAVVDATISEVERGLEDRFGPVR